MDEGTLALGNLDAIAFYDKPFLKFERLLETYYCAAALISSSVGSRFSAN